MDFKNLKELRKQRKITSGEMAKRMGVHRDTVNRIESGDEATSWKNVKNYIGVLGDLEIRLLIKQ